MILCVIICPSYFNCLTQNKGLYSPLGELSVAEHPPYHDTWAAPDVHQSFDPGFEGASWLCQLEMFLHNEHSLQSYTGYLVTSVQNFWTLLIGSKTRKIFLMKRVRKIYIFFNPIFLQVFKFCILGQDIYAKSYFEKYVVNLILAKYLNLF